MYTINIGLDIEKILPNLWKTIIITQNSYGEQLETCLFNMNPDMTTLVWVSEHKEVIDKIRESLGILSMSTTEEVTEVDLSQFSPGLSPKELLVIARDMYLEMILPDDSNLWYH